MKSPWFLFPSIILATLTLSVMMPIWLAEMEKNTLKPAPATPTSFPSPTL